ncbi:MAG TPA: hypothetical protein VJR47_07450 [Stellaceae bacterium]|nr:hypothetical protein [Stellaceae bacterium]
MSSATDSDLEALQAEIKRLRADFASLNETVRDLLRHGSADAVGKARESGERVWNEARRRVEGVTAEIEEKPVTSAVTAFGIGIVLGLLFSGRRGA